MTTKKRTKRRQRKNEIIMKLKKKRKRRKKKEKETMKLIPLQIMTIERKGKATKRRTMMIRKQEGKEGRE